MLRRSGAEILSENLFISDDKVVHVASLADSDLDGENLSDKVPEEASVAFGYVFSDVSKEGRESCLVQHVYDLSVKFRFLVDDVDQEVLVVVLEDLGLEVKEQFRVLTD